MSLLHRIKVGRTREREGWRERVKRAAAPRQGVVVPEVVSIPWIPSPMLIEVLTAHGMPYRHAVLIRRSKQLYYIATRFYFDVIEADNGDRAARERVDLFRESQEQLRHHEKELGNDPDRTEPVKTGASAPRIVVPRGINANG